MTGVNRMFYTGNMITRDLQPKVEAILMIQVMAGVHSNAI